jgi:predicted HicB family RNase H-like nuclease
MTVAKPGARTRVQVNTRTRVQVNTRVPPALHDRIHDYAHRHNISLSRAAENLLTHALDADQASR